MTDLVIIPARNESKMIGMVVREVIGVGFPVIVIDDGSVDATARAAAAAGATAIVRSTLDGGYGRAVLTGFEWALQWGASVIVTLDADGAHDPADVPGLVASHKASQAALTIGDRFSKPDRYLPSAKRWANFLCAALFRRSIGLSLCDVACGLRVYSRELARTLLERSKGKGFSLSFESLVVALENDGRIGTHPVSVRYDASTILATPGQEILDALDVAKAEGLRRTSGGALLEETIEGLRREVRENRAFSIAVDGELFFAHPVYLGSYLIQAQHPDLRSCDAAKSFQLL